MPSIGVIDDRDQDRNIIVSGIEVSKEDDSWEIIDGKPLPVLDQYPAWISQNNICVLIIDEMLDEEVQTDGSAVGYRGHELVDFIRKRFHTLPVFVITGYSRDPSLQKRFKDVEGIIERVEFANNYRKHTPRILRAAQQYLNIFQEEINELAEFAYKVAVGDDIDEEEEKRAKAIQFKLETAYSVSASQEINIWLGDAKKLLEDIERMRINIEEKLRNE